MSFFEFPIRRPVTITIAVLALVALSFLFGSKLNIEAFPKLEIPIIAISTVYSGAGPEEIEEQVSLPIEEAVGSVGNITRIESSSQDNLSLVLVEFEYNTNMDAAAADIREKLDKIKRDLPTGAESPVIIKADPADSPVVYLALSDKNNNMRRLRSIAVNEIRKELEKIAGIASVTIVGGEERAIIVHLDRNRMDALAVTPNMVTAAIKKENADVPSGRIIADDLEFNVRSMGKLKSIKDFEDIYVTTRNGEPVFLKDVATVEDGHKEIRTITRSNGTPCVTLEIRKNTDANTVKVADAVKAEVDKIQARMPAGIELKMVYDQSKFVRSSLKDLQDNAIEGSILAIIIVLIFLGSFKSTMVIGLSIPISVSITFLIMYFDGLTINMMTLVGFILAIGGLVDASIVVLENIFRHLEMGKDSFHAALDGTKEVGNAVTGAVLTHIVVFFPIFIMSGIAGQIFKPLAKTFIYAMTCSLITAVTVVPMLCNKILQGEYEAMQSSKGLMSRYLKAWDHLFGKVRETYFRMLNWSLYHRPLIVILAVIVFALSIYLAGFIKTELQGKWDRGDFLVNVETPVGSSLERTGRVVKEVEDFILKSTPELDTVTTTVGKTGSGGRGGGASVSSEAPRFGGFIVSLKPAEERHKNKMRTMYEVEDMISEKFKNYPAASVQTAELFNISGRKPIEILIRGNDLEKLASLAEGLKEKMKPIAGLKNLEISYRPGLPEYRIRVNRRKAAELGMGSGEVSALLRMLMAEDLSLIHI